MRSCLYPYKEGVKGEMIQTRSAADCDTEDFKCFGAVTCLISSYVQSKVVATN